VTGYAVLDDKVARRIWKRSARGGSLRAWRLLSAHSWSRG
jgi:hypothetical protein